MPRIGVEEIRREQICNSAANMISERGFAGTTMRSVAEDAGVSTGMINHYFANRQEMLRDTLVFVSEQMQARALDSIRDEPSGEVRVRAFLRAILPREPEVIRAWRIWIAGFSEAVRSEPLRETIEGRLRPWYAIIDRAIEGFEPPEHGVPAAWEFDALLNGLVLQTLTAQPDFALDELEDAMVAFVGSKRVSLGAR